MSNIEKIDDFLTQAQVFYLSTVNGNKPKCRPLGFHMVVNDKLYMAVGDFKDVYKQMQINPYVEVSAFSGQNFIRYYGKAVFETNEDIAKKALEAAPALKEIYNDTTGYKVAIFHLEEATAEFREMSGAITERYTF